MIPLFARVLLLISLPLTWLLAADQATPAAHAERWLSDPDSSLRAVLVLAGSLVQTAQSIGWQSWLLGGLTVAVGVLRFTPGWGPVVGWVYDNVLAKRQDVASERAAMTAAEGFRFLVGSIEDLPPNTTLAQLRDKLARKMPERIKDAVNQYLDQHGRALQPAPWPYDGVAFGNAEGVVVKRTEEPKA